LKSINTIKIVDKLKLKNIKDKDNFEGLSFFLQKENFKENYSNGEINFKKKRIINVKEDRNYDISSKNKNFLEKYIRILDYKNRENRLINMNKNIYTDINEDIYINSNTSKNKSQSNLKIEVFKDERNKNNFEKRDYEFFNKYKTIDVGIILFDYRFKFFLFFSFKKKNKYRKK
jgi:hypothetical protein